MRSNEWGDFQTPSDLAAQALRSLDATGWTRLLEPTCGLGRFLEASQTLGSDVHRIGIEIQSEHATAASRFADTVLEANLFDLDLSNDLEWPNDGPLVIVGNPPWVTNSQLGVLGSVNVPAKSNIRRLRGFDAMTGASNFDIAEHITLKIMIEMQAEKPTIALLVKTQVARNVLCYAEQFSMPYSGFTIRLIDAKKSFGASVDACLLTVEHSDTPEYACDVFPSIDAESPSHRIGVLDGRLVADIDKYKESSFADGFSPVEWRSGVKHDAARVMEITAEKRDALDLESGYVFPLCKCSDLFRNRRPTRHMVIPQRSFGERTEHLRLDAPKLWAYLEAHADVLDARSSSIYKKQPRFAVFGLGDYTFARYKIAISGLHKEVRFVLLGPLEGKPIVVDDASYLLGFDDGHQAAMCFAMLTSQAASDLLDSLVFWDAKRPISKKLLQRVDLLAVADKSAPSLLAASASHAAAELRLSAPESWQSVLDQLRSSWSEASTEMPLPFVKTGVGGCEHVIEPGA